MQLVRHRHLGPKLLYLQQQKTIPAKPMEDASFEIPYNFVQPMRLVMAGVVWIAMKCMRMIREKILKYKY